MNQLQFLRLAMFITLACMLAGFLAAVALSNGKPAHFDTTVKALLVPTGLLFVLLIFGLAL